MNETLRKTANTVFQDSESKRSAFALIASPGGKVLMIRKNDPNSSEHGRLEIPGGGLDDGENYSKGVIREVREETGYKINRITPISHIEHEGSKGTTELMIFVAHTDAEFTPQFTANPVTGEIEHTEFEWLTLDEVIQRDDIHSKMQKDIKQRIDIISRAIYDRSGAAFNTEGACFENS